MLHLEKMAVQIIDEEVGRSVFHAKYSRYPLYFMHHIGHDHCPDPSWIYLLPLVSMTFNISKVCREE